MRKVTLFSALTSLFLLSCGETNPTRLEASEKFFGAFCEKWLECDAEVFGYVYDDAAACVDDLKSEITAGTEDDVLKITNAELDTCVTDIGAAQCDDINEAILPESCTSLE